MNRQIRLRAVGGPEPGACDVRQSVVVVGRHSRYGVYRLGAVGASQEAVSSVVELRTLLEVIRPIRDIDGIPGTAVRFDCVLIDGGVNHPKIIEDTAGLGTFACAEEPGHRDRGQERDDRDNDHDFNEGETPAATIKFVKHCVKLLSVL